jgi:chromosome segregation ATPase
MCASDRLQGRGVRCAVVALACWVAATALAQGAPDREQEQLKRLKLQLRQVQQDQAAQQEAVARAEQARARADEAVKALQTRAQAEQGQAAAQARKLGALGQQLAEARQRGDSLQARVAELESALQAERTQAQSALARQGQAHAQSLQGIKAEHATQLGQCRQHNARLYEVGQGLLARYDGKGVGAWLGQHEPFVQMGRVALENARMQYQDLLDAERLR